MPIREETEEVEVTETKTTYYYVCDVDGCDQKAEGFDPRGDSDVAYGHVPHPIHYVSLDPYAETNVTALNSTGPDIADRVSVLVCTDHIDDAGRLLSEALDDPENHGIGRLSSSGHPGTYRHGGGD